ncbi:MAG: hypothetical protein Q8875_02965, partial [Pigeon pea little leaf phytoplasma]|nr:hypothetical protein [Pigeon pea little leaf phytoplasma]
ICELDPVNLKKHKTAITPDCLVYSQYTLHIPFSKKPKLLFLGKHGRTATAQRQLRMQQKNFFLKTKTVVS